MSFIKSILLGSPGTYNCFGINVEWRVKAGMARDRLDNGLGYRRCLFPVSLEPFLQLCDLTCTLDLDVQFDVLGQTRGAEVARTDEGL